MGLVVLAVLGLWGSMGIWWVVLMLGLPWWLEELRPYILFLESGVVLVLQLDRIQVRNK